MKGKHLLVDTKQSTWQLTAIQLAGWTSMPILATSILILQQNSFLGAALTIVVGNALLWFIRLAVVFMSHDKRQSTLDLAREYFGRVGSVVIAVLLLVSTFAWFLTQTTAASNSLTHLITLQESPEINQFVQVSVVVGLASTLLCMEGMVLLRWLSVLVFPVLVGLFCVIFWLVPHGVVGAERGMSLSGLSLVLASNLGVTSDMPTFFRHSNSWGDSVRALTVVQVVLVVLGLASLYFGAVFQGMFEVNAGFILESGGQGLRVALILFILLSAITSNVANVYSGSVGWEIVAPKQWVGRTEYLMLGLGLTTLFILFSNLFSLGFLLNVSDLALVNFCLVLVAGFLVSRAHGNSPGPFWQGVYFGSWVLATLVNGLDVGLGLHIFSTPLLASVIVVGGVTAGAFVLDRVFRNS